MSRPFHKSMRWIWILLRVFPLTFGLSFIKTSETFRLADLQLAEIRLKTGNADRVALDAATGSSLIRIPSSFTDKVRCEWQGTLLLEANSAAELLKGLVQMDTSYLMDWDLSYWKISDQSEKKHQLPREFTKMTILCAISNAIETPPALSNPKDHLCLVDSFHRLYLLKIVIPPKLSESLSPRWSYRPFPYSSATNQDVAEMVIDMLISQVDDPKCLLDPVCGSGTFLAIALERGLRAIGWDSNPSCVQGAEANLKHLNFTNFQFEVAQHDSCQPRAHQADMVACNLPWGISSTLYNDEMQGIIKALSRSCRPATPVAFVSKSEIGELLHDYTILEVAHIPPKSFHLPPSRKKMKSQAPSRTKRGDCIVTIARTSSAV